jgi:hypothetical protein
VVLEFDVGDAAMVLGGDGDQDEKRAMMEMSKA